jgi:alkylated DNA repair protein (DNA oxidative demethylase)
MTQPIEIAPGAVILPNYVGELDRQFLESITHRIEVDSPFRKMTIRGGKQMSVAMTNAGPVGWIASPAGYRYDDVDPLTGKYWPAMGSTLMEFANRAAIEAGYGGFVPDCCLINRYEPGAKLSLHQDKDEETFDSPIVSVSLGATAIFQFGGLKRTDSIKGYKLEHGDVVVFGGESRLCHHGILPLREQNHPLTGGLRYNLTFRSVYG